MITKLSSNPEESADSKERRLIKVVVSFGYRANHCGEWGGKMGFRLNSKVVIELKRKSSYANTYLVTVQGGMELKYLTAIHQLGPPGPKNPQTVRRKQQKCISYGSGGWAIESKEPAR